MIKKILVSISFLVVVLLGLYAVPSYFAVQYLPKSDLKGVEFYQIYNYVANLSMFQHSMLGNEITQPPLITLLFRRGDCDDKSWLIYAMSKLGSISDVHVVIGTIDGRCHSWIEYDGYIFDAAWNRILPVCDYELYNYGYSK